MATHALGREIPADVTPFAGAYERCPQVAEKKRGAGADSQYKLAPSLEKAIERSGLKDGMTISFHHHLRSGDHTLNEVMALLARMGFRNLTVAASSFLEQHAPIVQHIREGVVSELRCSGLRGKLGDAISAGVMDKPVHVQSHGGRARAITHGELVIDVAFLAVPACDPYGNASGAVGPAACGALGYAMVDARHARHVILLTDNLVSYPLHPVSIRQEHVDQIVGVESIGDPNGIATGATRLTRNPRDLLLAKRVSDVIVRSGYFRDGFSLQTGSGGASIAVTRYLREEMIRQKVKASFMLGGITQQGVALHEEGLIGKLYDTQTFDQAAIASLARNPGHVEISAALYADPKSKGCMVNMLDVVILSALEIDTDFNVNVMTGSDGVLRGASGGHSDTAAGAGLSIVIGPLVRGRTATVVDRVETVVTPGETVDVFVSDRGIAVNPRRPEVAADLRKAGLPVLEMDELRRKATGIVGVPQPLEYEDKVVALIEYRDGTIIDTVRKLRR